MTTPHISSRGAGSRRASVVVPAHDAARVVGAALDALARQTIVDDVEVIVVDDASSDGTSHVVTRWMARHRDIDARVHRRERRGGPNAARNDGIRMAVSDTILLCDGDDVTDSHWAEHLLAALDAHSARDVIVGGRCVALGSDDRPSDNVLHAHMTWGAIPYALGGNCGFRRRVAEAIGGFDEQIRSGGTEIDFAVRAHDALGVEIVDVPDAIVGYRLPTATWHRFRRIVARARGRAYLARRHGGRVGRPSTRDHLSASWRALARTLHQVATQRTPEVDPTTALARAVGSLWWSGVFALRMPPAVLGLAADRQRGDAVTTSDRSIAVTSRRSS